MTTNLIQSYIANKSSGVYSPVSNNTQRTIETPKKPMPDFDIQRELDNRTFIKPLKGKGRLISGNILNAPAMMFKDAVYDAKAFKHAVKGEANDHELGRLNDVGLKLGGLAIAGYLFTKKQTPMTKGMEFIGLASFLASMAIWPKIAIQLPAYLVHGVNVQKEYEDSFGRKKFFYQDPQFIPWDLYSDEEIQKIGNRLGVDKNIPNRRDAIQEKMKKIAIQNNTLWMLTAGFATPVMSALICNQSEPYLAKYLNNRKNKKADKILADFDKYVEKNKNPIISKKLERVIELYKDRPINKEVTELLEDALTDGMDLVTAESFKADLKTMLTDNQYLINDTTAKTISKNLKAKFKGKHFDEEVLNKILPDEDAMIKLFKDNNFLNNNVEYHNFKDVSDKVVLHVLDNINLYNSTAPDNKKITDNEIKFIKKLIINNKEKDHPIRSALNKIHAKMLNSDVQAKLRNIGGILDNFHAQNDALDKYALIKVGAAPETVIANYWNDSSKLLLKELGFSNKEIEKVRFDRTLMGELLRSKIEKVASNRESYVKVMDRLGKIMADLNNTIKPGDLCAPILNNNTQKPVKSNYENKVDIIFKEFADSIYDAGFHKTSQAINGINADDNVGTLKNIQKSYVSDRLLGVKSAFNRLYNTLIMYRKIATNPNDIQALKEYSREGKEEIIEFGKICTLQGHSSDFATKFYMARNPHPSTDSSPLEVKDGKIVNKYYGKTKSVVDIPGDKYFYQDALRLMYETDIDEDAMNVLNKYLIKDEFTNYRNLILDKIGGEKYFAKPRHRIRPQSNAGSELKFLLLGITPEEFFFKAGQQTYNTNKWLKIFGTFGGILLGATVLAQFFFGKTKSTVQKGNQQ